MVRGLALAGYIAWSIGDVFECDVDEVSQGGEFVGVDGGNCGGELVLLGYAEWAAVVYLVEGHSGLWSELWEEGLVAMGLKLIFESFDDLYVLGQLVMSFG